MSNETSSSGAISSASSSFVQGEWDYTPQTSSTGSGRTCPDERSPNATSKPISIPIQGQNSYPGTQGCLKSLPRLVIKHPRNTIHTYKDDITDYGPSGWIEARKERLKRENDHSGRVLAGCYVPRRLWEKSTVERKDVCLGFEGEMRMMEQSQEKRKR